MKNRILVVLTTLVATFFALPAFAAEAGGDGSDMTAIGAALAIGIAALGGGLGQGRAAAAALEGIARNPQASDRLFVPYVLGLALIESLVIYAFVIAMKLAGIF